MDRLLVVDEASDFIDGGLGPDCLVVIDFKDELESMALSVRFLDELVGRSASGRWACGGGRGNERAVFGAT